MPDSRRTGFSNPSLSGRAKMNGRSARVYRRPIQAVARRSIDGISISSTTKAGRVVNSGAPHHMTANPALKKVTRQTSISKPALPRQSRSVVLARKPSKAVRKTAKKIKTKKTLTSHFLIIMALLVFICGLYISIQGWRVNREAATQVEALSHVNADEGGGVPVEDDITPDVMAKHQVAADMPRLIRIPTLNISARIVRLGVKADGMLAAPKNIYDAGWYDGSSKPGENGAVLLDGHVHGPSKPGVFYKLTNIKKGDIVEIERGDGKVIEYEAVSTENVDQDKVDMAKALVSVSPGRPGLNIITCSGRYDIRTNKYEQRLIVYLVER